MNYRPAKEDVKPSPRVLSQVERAKQLAAWTAVDNHVFPEHKVRFGILRPFAVSLRQMNKVIGIGSGMQMFTDVH